MDFLANSHNIRKVCLIRYFPFSTISAFLHFFAITHYFLIYSAISRILSPQRPKK